jgi:hypothetical protein
MALPGFYNQGDQEIYARGDKFIPQEQYRLGYPNTPPPSISNAPTGITNTNVAQPFIWPPQEGGGGGGGFSNTNKFGLNLDTMKTISQGKYVEQGGPANMYGGDYVKTDRQIAQDEHGNWKDVNTNKNVYHGNINLKTPMTMIMDKLSGKKTTDDPYKDSWYGADWNQEDEDAGLYSKTIGPKNLIQRWKIKRDFKRAEAERVANEKAQAKLEADYAAARPSLQAQSEANRAAGTGGWQSGMAKDEGFMSGSGKSEDMGSFAQGGRIGMSKGMTPFQAWAASQGANINTMDINSLNAMLMTWNSLENKKAEGGLIGYFDGGIAGLL